MCNGSRELLPRLWAAVCREFWVCVRISMHLTPAIPHEWEEFEVNKVFRGCQLHIVVKNPGHVQSGCDRLLVNGVRMQGDYIPQEVLKKQTEIVLYMS